MNEPKATPEQLELVLDELRRLPLCTSIGSCNPAGLAAMAKLGRIESFPADVVVLTAGAPADALRFVISGRVALSFEHAGTGAHSHGSVSPGDLLGWSALRKGATWTVDARTTKPTRFVTFPGAEVRALCDRDRDLGYCLMRYVFEVVAQRLADTRVQLLDLYDRADKTEGMSSC